MKAPGFARACWLVALKDLRLEWRTLETLSASGVFSLVVLVVFQFAFGDETMRQVGVTRVIPGALWIVIAFAAVVGFSRSAHIERQNDVMGAVLMTPVDRSALFAGKALANGVKLGVVTVAVVAAAALLFRIDLAGRLGPLAAVVALHEVGLIELGTLFAAVSTRVGRGEALLATLLLPAASPLLLSAVTATTSVLEGRPLAEQSDWLMLAAGFGLLYLMVGLLTFEFVMEE